MQVSPDRRPRISISAARNRLPPASAASQLAGIACCLAGSGDPRFVLVNLHPNSPYSLPPYRAPPPLSQRPFHPSPPPPPPKIRTPSRPSVHRFCRPMFSRAPFVLIHCLFCVVVYFWFDLNVVLPSQICNSCSGCRFNCSLVSFCFLGFVRGEGGKGTRGIRAPMFVSPPWSDMHRLVVDPFL